MLEKKVVVVGYELGDYNSQISYYNFDNEEIETVSTITGGEEFNIPTVICKGKQGNQWFYGKEAYEYQNEGFFISNLLSLAEKQEMIMIGDKEVETISLLTIFIKKTISLLQSVIGNKKIDSIAFTIANLNQIKKELLEKIIVDSGIKAKNIVFYNKEETFFAYMLNQDKQLYKEQVVVCDITEGKLSLMRLEMNHKTLPIATFINQSDYEEIDFKKVPKTAMAKEEFLRKQDFMLSEIVRGPCNRHKISAFFLIGDHFQENWYPKTLQVIGNGRRIFQGNNMYSKGACYLAMERIEPSSLMQEYTFLGQDKIKANIGMNVIKEGKESYWVIVDGGCHWMEVSKEFDIILEKDNIITFQITSLRSGNTKLVDITLSGLPVRPKKASRVKIIVESISEYKTVIHIQDMGFGKLYPTSQLKWVHEIDIT